jgi:hypothetical protein
MNFLRQVFGVVERVEGDVAWVRDADGVERTIPNDREFEAGDSVELVLNPDDGSVVKVLDT